MTQSFEKTHTRRIIALILSCIVIFISAAMRSFEFQAVNGETYLANAQQSSAKNIPLPAARGKIVDRNGIAFTKNKVVFNVEFDYTFMQKKTKGSSVLDNEAANETIYKLIKVFENLGEDWLDELPITKTEPYNFLTTASDNDIDRMKHKIVNVNDYATAEDCLYWIYRKYGIKKFQENGICTHCGKKFDQCNYQGYSEEYSRKIAGVRYQMLLKDFSSYNTRFTFAEDIKPSAVQWLEEQASQFPGIIIVEKAIRDYASGNVASHLIGVVGPIYEEQYENYKKQGYLMNDIVGKSGIESAFESELRGHDGNMAVYLDSTGSVVNTAETKPAVAGNTIQLTIDYNFQKEIQQILADYIKNFNETNKLDKHVPAASIVVLDKTGGLLACVSYPYYNINDYLTNYTELANREGKPLNNWALNGLYRPGSTFKPIVAAGALTEGIITPESTVLCTGKYHFYPGWSPGCLQYKHHNVRLDVRKAIEYSCNIFFYDTGRRLGIEKMNKYANLFGLGTDTGLEITNAKGILTTKNTPNWQEGNVIQAAIGQMDTQVTPLQMALEALTLANHGTRYKAHLIRNIVSSDCKTTINTEKPEIVSKFNLSDTAFEAISDGMVLVGNDVNRPNQLTDLGYKVAVKTGTPQVSLKKNNNGFIAFAPVDNPEISISCMIEDGNASTVLIRRILLAYQKTKIGSNLAKRSSSVQSQSSSLPNQQTSQE